MQTRETLAVESVVNALASVAIGVMVVTLFHLQVSTFSATISMVGGAALMAFGSYQRALQADSSIDLRRRSISVFLAVIVAGSLSVAIFSSRPWNALCDDAMLRASGAVLGGAGVFESYRRLAPARGPAFKVVMASLMLVSVLLLAMALERLS